MAIRDIQVSKQLRTEGARLGRKGLAERINKLVVEFVANYPDGHYKEGVQLAGRLHALSLACRFDPYWGEKATIGLQRELGDLPTVEAPDVK